MTILAGVYAPMHSGTAIYGPFRSPHFDFGGITLTNASHRMNTKYLCCKIWCLPAINYGERR